MNTGIPLPGRLEEAPYLINPLTDQGGAAHPKILSAEIAKVPALLVEMEGKRIAMSPEKLSECVTFRQSNLAFFGHAEWLIREVRANASLSALITSLNASELQLPKGTRPMYHVSNESFGQEGYGGARSRLHSDTSRSTSR